MALHQFCRVVLQEKMAGRLPNLRTIGYSFLNADETFPHTPHMTFPQLRTLFRTAGATIRRN
jgi:hypothetical protein